MPGDRLRVTRLLRLAAPLGAVPILADVPGMLVAPPKAGDRALQVSYDLDRFGWDDIIRLLMDTGVTPAGGFFQTMRRGWIRFTERNLRDQSKLVHRCCSSPPDRSERSQGRPGISSNEPPLKGSE